MWTMNTNELEVALAEIDADIAAAEQALDELRLQRLGAQALLARMGNRPGRAESTAREPVATPPGTGPKDLVTNLLSRHPAGLHINDIRSKLEVEGHALYSEQVRSAVTYLKRKGKAETVARGVWRLVGPDYAPTNAEATADTVASDVPVPTSERSDLDATDASSSAEADDLDHARMGAPVGGF